MPRVLNTAKKMGYNPASFKQCIESSAIKKQLLEDVAEGDSAGVKATPTLYLNGKKLKHAHHPVILSGILDYAYKKETGGK